MSNTFSRQTGPRLTLAFAACAVLAPAAMRAQAATCSAAVVPLDLALDPRHRLDALRVAEDDVRAIVRDALVCPRRATAVVSAAPRFAASLPDLRLIWAGDIPDSRNDGGLWAGRGTSLLARAGFLADAGPFHLALVPEVRVTQNQPFDFFPSPSPARSSFASAFYSDTVSIDLPSRMGASPVIEFATGQSALWMGAGPVELGWSSSEQQWGVGRESLLLGNSAGGIPRAFARTSRPVASSVGMWNASWFLGVLSESRAFDRDSSNDTRTISAFALAWSPPASSALTLGAARAVTRVLAPGTSPARDATAAFAALGPATGDEITAVFGRVHLARGRLRAWFELAHAGPLALRDVLTSPLAGVAYLFGFERAVERESGAWVFLLEAANLDQPQAFLDRPVHDFYSGWGTPQGWTQRGQLLGSGAGPGGSSQFISADWVPQGWFAGVFAERVRWNEDAFFRQYLPYPNRHDVSLRGGVRGGTTRRGYEFLVEASWGKRLNYLFQNSDYIPDYRTVDVPLLQLKLRASPIRRSGPALR